MHSYNEQHSGKLGPSRVTVLLEQDQIQARIQELGAQLTRDYAGSTLTIVGVLKGAVLFMADLIRHIDLPVRCEFLGISSYGHNRISTGEVRVTSDLTQPIHGEDVVIIEDIIDTGVTLAHILKVLATRGPKSIKLCCLLDKRERRQIEIEADYVGFVIPNRFVVGYGLDNSGLLRNLPFIGVLTPETENL